MAKSILEIDQIPNAASPVGVATTRLSQLVRAELDKLLSNYGKLSLIEWRICNGLAELGAISQKDLVAYTRTQQSQVSRSLRQLEDRKLIKSTRSVEDRRARNFELTAKGNLHVEQSRPVAAAFREQIAQTLSEEETALFLEMAERVAQATLEVAPKLAKENRGAA